MKKKNNKLQLNKETVAKLNEDSMSMVRGGALANANAGFWTFDKCTDGCTDGCTVVFYSKWNCTKTACSNDCLTTIQTCTDHCNTWVCETKVGCSPKNKNAF